MRLQRLQVLSLVSPASLLNRFRVLILLDCTLIHHFLENSTKRFPDKVALVHEDVRATYEQINSQANQLAHLLIDSGVCFGDRVVLLLENSLEYVVAYYGVLKAGAVAVPLNTELKPEGVQYLLAELDAKFLLTQRKFERLLRQVRLDDTSIHQVVIKNPKLGLNHNVAVLDWDEVSATGSCTDLNLDIRPDQLGSIIYTSGSTGRPKGAMLSHGNIVANVKSICEYLSLTDSDIQMVVQPFFYVMGKSLLNTHIAVAGRLVINNKFAYPATVINQMIEEKVTGFSGVPSTYAHLLHQSPLAASREKLQSLRYCTQAGGHMASTNKLKLMDILPNQTELFIMYGATEASARLAYVEPEMLKQKVDSIGKAIPGATLKVLNSEGHELPVGEVGELVASGENIMQGYWKNIAATKEALSLHGYHTGDLGYRDEDGYFFVVGRKDNQLKVSGHRINTQEIEDVIFASNLVVEVVVLGIPDPLLENRLIAFVSGADSETDEKDISTYCSKQLPSYKIPLEVVFVDTLPKSASGKIDRKGCEQLLATDMYR